MVTTTIRLRVDFNSAATRPTFDSRSTAIRPRYDHSTTYVTAVRPSNRSRIVVVTTAEAAAAAARSIAFAVQTARYRTGLSVTAVASRHNSRCTQSLRVMAALRLRVIVLDRRPADDGPTHTAAPVCLSVSPSSSVLRRLAGRGCY